MPTVRVDPLSKSASPSESLAPCFYLKRVSRKSKFYWVIHCLNMAKVTGPLMSMSASGSVAGAIVFATWKGVAYVRQLVIPANPNTADQQGARSVLGSLAKSAAAVLTSTIDSAFVGSPFFTAARDLAPSGQSWVSYFQKVMNPLFAARVTAYAALSSTIKGYYNTSATGIGLASYVDKADVTHTAGEQLYILAYFATIFLGYTMTGGIDAPASTTPTNALATWVNSTTP